MSYSECVRDHKRKSKGSLCSRGYCTAKAKFEVYPSAYANGYAVGVCAGRKPDHLGDTYPDEDWVERKNKIKSSKLRRWYDEVWVNVCQSGDGPGGFALCGTGKGVQHPSEYPYCRPYYRQPGTQLVTAPELSAEEIDYMCRWKRSLPQGIRGKPTYVRLSPEIRERSRQKITKPTKPRKN